MAKAAAEYVRQIGAGASARLAEHREDDERNVQTFHKYSVDRVHHFHKCCSSLKSIHNDTGIKETSHV